MEVQISMCQTDVEGVVDFEWQTLQFRFNLGTKWFSGIRCCYKRVIHDPDVEPLEDIQELLSLDLVLGSACAQYKMISFPTSRSSAVLPSDEIPVGKRRCFMIILVSFFASSGSARSGTISHCLIHRSFSLQNNRSRRSSSSTSSDLFQTDGATVVSKIIEWVALEGDNRLIVNESGVIYRNGK